jgi:DNA-binding CsgD family transcriptional regulator
LHVSIDTDTLQSSEISPLTLGQRRCWFAVAELCLAAQDYGAALYVADRLIASAANIGAGGIIAPLWLLRGQALTALGRTAEAGAVLEQAQNDAEQEGEQPLLWRIHVGRGRMHDAQGRREEAASAFASAAGLIAELCARIPEGEIRQNFAKRAEALMPKAQLPTAKQMAKREFGGLTDRERDVARLIARGKSNRDTATALVVSERTVETHVSSILSKLGFSSRAQIAAWAVEKGLLRDNET